MAKFQWDERKRVRNYAKHGVDFLRATEIFETKHLLWDVSRPEEGERRYCAIGEARGEVLAVVFTWRASKRRLISARRASRNERRAYYQLHY